MIDMALETALLWENRKVQQKKKSRVVKNNFDEREENHKEQHLLL